MIVIQTYTNVRTSLHLSGGDKNKFGNKITVLSRGTSITSSPAVETAFR